MQISKQGSDIIVSDYGFYDLALTLDCGQAFRFSQTDNGEWVGIALGRQLKIRDRGDSIVFYDMTEDEFKTRFIRYFDFERDYKSINELLSKDSTLKSAIEVAGGIHILRQDIWETICSFIISQNNNIPRIKGIIERLCENFGEPCGDGFSFPTAEKIASLSVDDLAPIRAGFRAKYLIDASQKISQNEVDIEKIEEMSSDDAREELKKIKGIGDKVANCILLFAFGRVDIVPIDVWIKRSLTQFYGEEKFPDFVSDYAGIAQQYLFHYARMLGKEGIEEKK